MLINAYKNAYKFNVYKKWDFQLTKNTFLRWFPLFFPKSDPVDRFLVVFLHKRKLLTPFFHKNSANFVEN